MNLSIAVYSLLNLADRNVRTWCPQLLLCIKTSCDTRNDKSIEDEIINQQSYVKLFEFAQRLKKGKGLTIATSIIKGEYLKSIDEIQEVKEVC